MSMHNYIIRLKEPLSLLILLIQISFLQKMFQETLYHYLFAFFCIENGAFDLWLFYREFDMVYEM